MENRIIYWIDMNVTAMTAEEEQGFREFLHELELESFDKERRMGWGKDYDIADITDPKTGKTKRVRIERR